MYFCLLNLRTRKPIFQEANYCKEEAIGEKGPCWDRGTSGILGMGQISGASFTGYLFHSTPGLYGIILGQTEVLNREYYFHYILKKKTYWVPSTWLIWHSIFVPSSPWLQNRNNKINLIRLFQGLNYLILETL